MLHLFLDNKPWFAPKSHGLGSGLPIAWQGWVLLLAHVAAIVGVTFLFIDRPGWMIVAVLVVSILPFPIYAAKTKGGWHWRWGDKK